MRLRSRNGPARSPGPASSRGQRPPRPSAPADDHGQSCPAAPAAPPARAATHPPRTCPRRATATSAYPPPGSTPDRPYGSPASAEPGTPKSFAPSAPATKPERPSDPLGTRPQSQSNRAASAPPLVQRPHQLVRVTDRRSTRPLLPDLANRRTPGSLRDRPRPTPQIRKHLRVLQQRLSTSRIDLHSETHPTTRFNEIRPPGLNPNGPNV